MTSLRQQLLATLDKVPQAIGSATDRVGTFYGDTVDANSVSTDYAAIANAPTGNDDALRWQEGVETGVVTADGVDNSGGNDDWGQGTARSVTTSFDNAFAATPRIGIGEYHVPGVATSQWQAAIANISATSFDINFWQMSADDNSGTTDAYKADYVATEGR